MAVDLVIVHEAEQDIAQAYAWYESQRNGLGEDFLGRLDSCVQNVLRNPEMYELVLVHYRRAFGSEVSICHGV